MEILDNTTMSDFVHFHKKVLALLFKVRNFKTSADKSECMKVRLSYNKCLDLMHTKFHASAAPASWSDSKRFSLPS